MIRTACLLCLLLPQLSLANDATLAELRSRAEAIRTITSSFVQEKHLSLFDEVMVSEGRFAFERPASLRWEYTAPFKNGFLLVNDKGIEWDEASSAHRPFTTQSSPAMAMVAAQIMAWTTFDTPWLESRYEITQRQADPVILELQPKSQVAKEFLTNLIVTFSENKRTVSELELHETGGDFTRIRFTETVVNAPLPETTFTSVR